jgi:hypothetical protein
MGSPWEFAIAQAMQRHGGSNRSVPKAAHTKPVVEPSPERSDAADPLPQGAEVGASAKPDDR